MKDSGLIIKTYRLKTPEIPLEINKEPNIFKVYMADTGLLVSQFDEAVIKAFISGNLGHFKGALYENVIAQILHSKRKIPITLNHLNLRKLILSFIIRAMLPLLK